MTQETGATGSVSPTQTLPTGEIVAGKYQIERLIGSGGMAEVYAALNVRTDRRVALKWILPALATSPEVLARFRREALAAGRINHPNVVTIFDVVEHQSSACMVMEMLSGETLRDANGADRPMAFVEAVAIIVLAMRGVAAAHAHGVIHRDLKPDNIFLCLDADGSIRECKVLDFGVSKLAAADAAMAGDITLSGSVIGTPEYMAPEQVRSGKNADHRIDIYSLGVVFYEMLAGRPPFVGEHFSGLMLDIMQRDPPSPERAAAGVAGTAGRGHSPGAAAGARSALCRHGVIHRKRLKTSPARSCKLSLGPAAEGVVAKIAAHRPTPEVRRSPHAGQSSGWKLGLAIAAATGLARPDCSGCGLTDAQADNEPVRPPAQVPATAAAEPVSPPVPAAADPANAAAPLPPSTRARVEPASVRRAKEDLPRRHRRACRLPRSVGPAAAPAPTARRAKPRRPLQQTGGRETRISPGTARASR